MASPPLTAGQAGWPQLLGAATTWRTALRAGLAAAYSVLRGTQHAAHQVAAPVKEKLADGAVAVAGGAAKVAHAPAELAREVRREVDAWWGKTSKALAESLALGALGLIMLILLTVGIVVLLNDVLGDPFGTLVVAALYLVAIGALLARREVRKEGRQEAEDRKDVVLAVEHPAAQSGTADELPREMPPGPTLVRQPTGREKIG